MSTFSFEEIFSSLPGNGWLERDEAELLWATVNLTQGPILEVGSNYGRSTTLLGATGRTVYSVDPYDYATKESDEKAYQAFLENMRGRNLTNVEQFRQRIEDWHPLPVGFAYLDGDHTFEGTQAQIRKALRCNPSVVAIHDVNDSGGGVAVRDAAIGILGPWLERVNRLAVWRIR